MALGTMPLHKMSLPRPLFVYCIVNALVVFTTGCSDKTNKEHIELKAQVTSLKELNTSLESGLAKKTAEIDSLQESGANAKKREYVLTQKITDNQKDISSLTAQLTAIKEASKIFEDRAAMLSKELDATRAERRKELAELQAKQAEEQNKVTVDFQASATFRNGDTKPIASTEFSIITKSVDEIAQETGISNVKGYLNTAVFLTSGWSGAEVEEQRKVFYEALKNTP